jgi:hypothetical protein
LAIAQIAERVQDLIKTGLAIFNSKLAGISSEKLAPRAVEIWTFFYGTVIPYFHGVFLPLEMELRSQHHAETSIRRMLLFGFRDSIVLPSIDRLTGILFIYVCLVPGRSCSKGHS